METIAMGGPEQLAALNRHAVIDTLPEAAFDRLLHLAARLFQAPAALISFVGASRPFFKTGGGLDLQETGHSLSFCSHPLHCSDVLVIPDAALDGRFAHSQPVTGHPQIRFYAGAPLVTPDGTLVGTLCVIDHLPRAEFTSEDRAALSDLAALVVDDLELRVSRQEADREAQAREGQAREVQGALQRAQLLQGLGDLGDLDLRPRELLPHVVELVGAALDVDWGGLMVLQGDGGTLLSHWHGPAGGAFVTRAGNRLRREHGGLFWTAARQAQPLFVDDYAAQPAGRADLKGAGGGAVVSARLAQDGPLTYVMTLARVGRAQPWTARDRHLVGAVLGVVRQSVERAAGRAALHASQEQLQLALETAPVILWAADMAGIFTLSEGRGLAVLGAVSGALVGRSVQEVYADHPGILVNIERALAGERFMTNVRVGERVYEARYAPLLNDEGQQIGILGSGYDVTTTVRAQRAAVQARKAAERARTQAEALLALSHLLGPQADLRELAQTALAAVSQALGNGALVLWRQDGDTLRPLALHGELPAALQAQFAGGVPVTWDASSGVLTGQPAFLCADAVPARVAAYGVRGLALLPVALDVSERAWVLGVYRLEEMQTWTAFEQELLMAAARTLAAGVARQRHLRRLETAAHTDTLTGLGNRRAFELDLAEVVNRAGRQGTAVGVLSIDLDGLKRFNDTQGHARGDALLREFARHLRQSLREVDRVHRLGGDEYMVVLPGVGPDEEGVMLERVRAAVDATRAAGFAGVDASVGLACFLGGAGDVNDLVRQSDTRMYADKARKRAHGVSAQVG